MPSHRSKHAGSELSCPHLVTTCLEGDKCFLESVFLLLFF